jgi:DNA-binding MarR family transcriptional regulator
MSEFDFSPGNIDRTKLFNDAADGKLGMIALLITLVSSNKGETAVPALGVNEGGGENRPCHIRGGTTSLAEQFLRLRRHRDKIFGSGFFGEPAWDILLDLFLARAKGLRPVSITSLCIASAVPSTTALRWIGFMVQEGLLVRDSDPLDRRRVFIHLTDAAWQKMHDLLRPWADKA